MSLTRFIWQLEETADNIGVEQRYVLAALLRQAAIRLRNSNGVVIEPEMDLALKDIAAKLGESKPDLIRHILREWLERHSCRQESALEEHTGPKGAERFS
jgi:hypothetical protein